MPLLAFASVRQINRSAWYPLAGLIAIGFAGLPNLRADEKPAAKLSVSTEKDTEETEQTDAIEIPDGTPDELFDFIRTTMKNRGRTKESVMKAARAVVDAAAKIRRHPDVEIADELKAIDDQLPALQFLARLDKSAKAEYDEVLKALEQDDRPEIQKYVAKQALTRKIAAVSSASPAEQSKLVAEVKEIMANEPISKTTVELVTTLARRLSDTSEAVSLYNDLADRMEKSDDEQLSSRAQRVRGSARRLDLPGKTMKLEGMTDRGEPFDWQSYRGKVVLVDFWASWCGPCRREIPNMKRNLKKYAGDFDIVGINMDRTAQAMNSYIDEEEIKWVNIVGDPETGVAWQHPIAQYYGVSGIPTAILVDRDGKVVSLSARGSDLDELLVDMLGEREEPPEDTDDEESSDKSSDKS